jgi:hypothetical protein
MCWISHLALTIRVVQGFRGRSTTSQRLAATVIATLVSGCVAVAAGGAASSVPAGEDGDGRQGVVFHPGSDASRTVLHYRGAVEGRTVPDASGAGNPGRLLSGRGGDVVSARSGRHGRYLRFTGTTCSRRAGCPWAAIVVRRAGNPEGATGRDGEPIGVQDFTFGARVRLTAVPGRTGMTVIRRGSSDGGEAHWSLEVDDGRVSCRWSDGDRAAVLPDDLGRSVALELGRWYALACSRHGDRFGLTVTDPLSSWSLGTYSEVVDGIGEQRPRGPITIGAGGVWSERDGAVTAPFHGDLDEVMVRSG